MAKKKVTQSQVHVTLGEVPQTGRRPIRPKTVDARLNQLTKESDTWLRLFREIWCNPSDPLVGEAVGASELPDLPQLYDDAIDVIRWVAASATYAEGLLAKGKAKVIKKYADAAKKRSSVKK